MTTITVDAGFKIKDFNNADQIAFGEKVATQVRADALAAATNASLVGHIAQFRAAEDAFENACAKIDSMLSELWVEVEGYENGLYVTREFVHQL